MHLIKKSKNKLNLQWHLKVFWLNLKIMKTYCKDCIKIQFSLQKIMKQKTGLLLQENRITHFLPTFKCIKPKKERKNQPIPELNKHMTQISSSLEINYLELLILWIYFKQFRKSQQPKKSFSKIKKSFLEKKSPTNVKRSTNFCSP